MKYKINKKTKNHAGAFTLMEVMLSVLIVGLAIVALMMLFGAGTTVNAYGNQLSSAVFLAEQMRSMTDQVQFNDLLSYDNSTYNGVDAEGSEVTGLEVYQQRLDVQPINPDDMTIFIGPDPQVMLLTASVSYAGSDVTTIKWLRTK